MDMVILWAYALACWVPMLAARRSDTPEKLMKVVRLDIALAVTAPIVGLYSDGWLWLYVILGVVWAFSAYMRYRTVLLIEETERIKADIAKRLEAWDENRPAGS